MIDHSIQYLFDKASHLGYRTKLTGLVNATRNLVSSGFPSFRINLSPFTKDVRGGEQLDESVNKFFVALPRGGDRNETIE